MDDERIAERFCLIHDIQIVHYTLLFDAKTVKDKEYLAGALAGLKFRYNELRGARQFR